MSLSVLVVIVCGCLSRWPALAAEPAVQVMRVSPDASPDESLQHYLCSSSTSSSSGSAVLGSGGITLLLAAGRYTLPQDSTCVVRDLSHLVIRGEAEGGSVIACTPGLLSSNLIFLNITNLTLQGVSIEDCGHVVPPSLPPYVNNTPFYLHPTQKAAVVMALVADLRLADFVMTRSYGFGVIGVNLQGDAELHNVTVTDTNNYRHPLCHGNETDMSCSGSGIVLMYSDPTSEDQFTLSDTTFTVSKSSITHNQNEVPISLFVPVFLTIRGSFQLERLLLTGATGLGIYCGQRNYDVDVRLLNSSISRNTGYASGLAFFVFNTIRGVSVDVRGCTLERNEGFELARGGGLLMLVINYVSELDSFPDYPQGTPQHQFLTVSHTSFLGNFADIGGGAYFYFTPQNVLDYAITFDNVTFRGNRARIATVLEADIRPATFVQNSVHFLLKDVIAVGNGLSTAQILASPTSENSASFVFVSIFNVTVSGRNETSGCLFAHNSPGAFLVVGGHLYLQGNMQFVNNTALRGGALSLYDFALLFIHEGSRIIFSNNSAISVGGAVYADSPGTGVAPTCVFQVLGSHRIFSVTRVSELDLKMKFVGNSATEGGNSIYVNPLYGCASLPESSLLDISVVYNSSLLYAALFQFVSPVKNGLSEIASVPERVCFCSSRENESHTSAASLMAECELRSVELTVVPGQKFLLNVFPLDLGYNPVSSILFVDTGSFSHSLGSGQTTSQLKGSKCTSVELNLYGPQWSKVRLTLHTEQGTSPVWMDVRLDPCPPGFVAVTPDGKDYLTTCECDPFVQSIGSTCNFSAPHHSISRTGNTWLGVVEHENFSDVVKVRTCPIGFCNQSLSQVDLSVEDVLCEKGRTGILCGACRGNLSVVFGSAECMECSNYWLFTIFLYALAGVLLVGLLFFLNVTVAQGSISGITVIFYVNLVSVNSNVLFSNDNRGFLFIWVSILNLELGFPLCFFDGMNEAVKAGLQCIFPLYLLLLCLGIILFSRWFKHVARLTSFHGIQVLATLIYLSFGKMLRYVIDILTFATLNSEQRNHIIWLYDGNLEYFTGSHAFIVIAPAAVTLVFISLYTLVMVFIKQVEQCTSKLKPLLDAYGGPFKDPLRFWFGLRLLVLSAMCLTYALIGTDEPVLAVLIQLVFLVLFMVLQAYLRPFRSPWMNAIDLFFMLDLFFLLLYTVKVFDVDSGEKARVVNALVSLAFILFVLLICYHIYRIPKIREKLSPHVKRGEDKLQRLLDTSQWRHALSSCCCRRRGRTKKGAEQQDDGIKLKRVSVDRSGGVALTGSSTGGGSVSTTVISLDSSVNADVILREGDHNKFTRFRESLMEDMSPVSHSVTDV